MSKRYYYRSKSKAALKQIADLVLTQFAGIRQDWAVDIEAIVEGMGIDILYREMRGIPLDAYLARTPRTIVVNQYNLKPLTRFRFTLAHELSHHILEFQLWNEPGLRMPRGATYLELTPAQYRAIERDAGQLAAELLQPEDHYRERFATHKEELVKKAKVPEDQMLGTIIHLVARDFDVSPRSAGYRAVILGFITQQKFELMFPIIY